VTASLLSVVDASAIGAIAFGEPSRAEIAGRLEGRTLVATTLLPHEVANIGRMKVRRLELSAEQATASVRLAAEIPIEMFAVQAEDLLATALSSGLTAYDAAYLGLARALGAELVTLDERLAHAAQS
jgi:predicted nucleic acid-binding protein